MFCHISLIDKRTNQDRSTVQRTENNLNYNLLIDTSTPYQNIVGSRMQPGMLLIDPSDNIRKVFFIFNDVSIRVIGEYRIKCELINMDITSLHFPCFINHQVVQVTEPIQVHSTRTFPGIESETALTKSFSYQGIAAAGKRHKIERSN